MDLLTLVDEFGSENACREVLAELRWPQGVTCPQCGAKRHAYDSTRFVWDCYSCGYQFSAIVGTIFQDTKLPLRKWFMAVLLMVEAKKGISANQMKRTLGISYKTAWYLCHRIRKAMAPDHQPMDGVIEADETYVGGKARNMHKDVRRQRIQGRGSVGKAIVAGVVQRGGDIRLKLIKSADLQTLHTFLKENVHPNAEAIYTDAWPAYKGVGTETTPHESVDHNADEWVRGLVHTQTAENVWSLLDRSIIGSYHHLSVKHLDAYLGELEWRFNNRKNEYLFRDTLTRLVQAETLEYKTLISTDG